MPVVEKRVEIRWRDVDAYGHVNNAVYLTYLEEARDAWVERVLGSATDTWDLVLARVAIDYRAELTLDDRVVAVRCELRSVGTSSFVTSEQIRKQDGTLSAEAESVLVARDRDSGRSRHLTDAERAALEAEAAAG